VNAPKQSAIFDGSAQRGHAEEHRRKPPCTHRARSR
jgi:hypothetical protein